MMLASITLQAQTEKHDYNSLEIGVEYQLENYTVPVTSNWHTASLNAKIGMKNIVWLPQITYGSRLFDKDSDASKKGLAAQLDIYPKFSPKLYMYGSYGYSASEVFPRQRAAAELYYAVGHGWELSGGAKYTFFPSNEGSHIVTYTVSGSKYLGRYLVALRGNLTDQSTNKTLSPSGTLTTRRYFANERDYLQLSLIYGISAEDVTYFQTGARLTNISNSLGTAVSVKKTLFNHFVLSAGLWYRYENYHDSYTRNVFGFGVGTSYRF